MTTQSPNMNTYVEGVNGPNTYNSSGNIADKAIRMFEEAIGLYKDFSDPKGKKVTLIGPKEAKPTDAKSTTDAASIKDQNDRMRINIIESSYS